VSDARPFDRTLAALWWGFLTAGGALFAGIAACTMLYPHELVVSEAAVGLGVQSLLSGTPPYAMARFTTAPFVVLHYTPLYYLIAAPLMAATGSMFAAGRGVSIAFTLATAAVACSIARRATGSRETGIAAALLWLSFYQVAFWGTVQRVDAPGIFFEGIGLLSALRARDEGRAPWRALPWFLAAWCVKQVMVVGLIATVAEFAWRERRRGVAFAAAGFGAIATLFVGFNVTSGGAFWRATVLGTVSAQADTPWVVLSNAELFFGSPWNMLAFVLAGAGATLLRDRLLAIYLGAGLVIAVASDANFPRFFPPMLGMAVLVAALLDRCATRPALRRGALVALLLFGASHVVYEMRPLVRERILATTPGNERLALAEALATMTAPDARVLAQDTGMVLSARRAVAIADPLVMSILAGNGVWDPGVLAEDVRAGRYGAIVLNRPLDAVTDTEWTTLWIAPIRGLVAERYRLAAKLTCSQSWRFLEPDRYVYLPKDLP
jgi:hypothetical protein